MKHVSRKSVESFIGSRGLLTPTDQQICRERLAALDEDSGSSGPLVLSEVVSRVFHGIPDVAQEAVSADWDRLETMADAEFSRAIDAASVEG